MNLPDVKSSAKLEIKKEIIIQTGPCDGTEQGNVDLSWTHLSALYSCTYSIISKEEEDSKIYVRALLSAKITKKSDENTSE
jgi:hypothetical protein